VGQPILAAAGFQPALSVLQEVYFFLSRDDFESEPRASASGLSLQLCCPVGQANLILPAAAFPGGWTRRKAVRRLESSPHNSGIIVILTDAVH